MPLIRHWRRVFLPVILIACVVSLLIAAFPVFGQPSPAPTAAQPEDYRPTYLLYRQAENLYRKGEPAAALEKYRGAERAFSDLQSRFPDWNREAIDAQLELCRKRIEEIQASLAERASWERPLRVHFLDVGQGDSALIQCPDGSTIVIDGGQITCYPFLVKYLKEAGVAKIDLIIATHPDGDHIGGLLKLLKTFPVGTVLDPGKEHTTRTYQRFLEAVRSSPGTRYKLARTGDRYPFGEVELRILHPTSHLPKDNNNCSVVARVTQGTESFLFTGDAEKEAEQEMLGRGENVRSSVLKVGHHGSRSSSSARFLSAVSPKLAVISAAAGNSYGHPHKEVVKRLESAGVEILRTDRKGTILILSNGKARRVEYPGRAVYPEYEMTAEEEGKVIGDKVTLFYHLPGGRYRRRVPPEEREYFSTESEAAAAGYVPSWR